MVASRAEAGNAQRYERLRRALDGVALPAALVDLDAFDENARALFAVAKAAGKTVRIATKSVRSPALTKRLLELGDGVARGLMTYAATETAFLFARGFNDLLLAYPTVQKSDAEILCGLVQNGATLSIVVDGKEQLASLAAAAAKASVRLNVLVEVDMSLRLLGQHFGARRSPLRSVADAVPFADEIAKFPSLRFYGAMCYEGQIAGVADKNPFARSLNGPKRIIKKLSRPRVEKTRRDLAAELKARGMVLFNGGGTGSLHWAAKEPWLTEVTAGSGFLCSHLFDYYRDLALAPAAYFALQVVRRPSPTMVTCHGGGLVASGQAGADRLPVVALPEGCRLLPLEGAGEVQTPVVLSNGTEIALGDPIFFRHAKAGELAEHFSEYLLVRGDRVEGRAPTYRGLGECFLG
jgi:D-serine deaminase-like pyridoxal phosphate-dependent protein